MSRSSTRGLAVPAEDDVTIASLNLHFGRDRDGERFDVEAACRSLKADVIALQETWGSAEDPNAIGAVAEALGFEILRFSLLEATDLHSHGVVDLERNEGGAWGLAVLTALPVADYDVLDLGMAPGDMARRAAQLATVIAPNGRALRVVNTHLTHRVFASPVQMRRLTRRLVARPNPTVIVGDLNMVWPVTMIASGYRRAARGTTWPAHRSGVQLDHILVNRALDCVDGELLDPVGSDHLPIRARLRFA